MMKIREKLSRKLISHILKTKISNRKLLKFYWFIYKVLTLKYPYKSEYKRQKQHFVPQLLLRNFRINQHNLIYEYKRGRQKPSKKSISKQVALEEDYYTFRDKQKRKSNFIENKIFAELLENFVPKIIDELKRCSDVGLTNFEESILASFIAHQYTRTPAFRKQVKNFILYLILKKGYRKDDLGSIDFIKEMIVENKLGISLKELMRFRMLNKATARYNLEAADNYLILASLLIAEYVAEKIFRKNLHILKAEKPNYFFLSDNPVSVIDLENKMIDKLTPWWNIEKASIIIFLPISPDRCIFLCKRIKRGGRIDSNIDFVNLVRQSLMIQAQNYLYSHVNSSNLQEEFNSTNDF